MKTIHLMTGVLAVAVISGCGSKDKKTTKQPAVTSTAAAEEEPAPAPVAEETPTEQPDPASLTDKIYFEFDSSELGDDARAALEENAKWLKEDPARTIMIEGHTDETGTSEYNLGLGDRRARASKDYLVALGIDDKRIRIITYGEERPESEEDSKNRRSVFVATKK